MNIKKGDVLKRRGRSYAKYTVLAVVDGIFAVSSPDSCNQVWGWFTLEGLKEIFELPEEKSDEVVRIAYGDENISINKGNQHIILSKKDLNFVMDSLVKNCEIKVETLQA